MARPRVYEEDKEEVSYLHTIGWSVREIAKDLDIPKSTVHRMIKRAKEE